MNIQTITADSSKRPTAMAFVVSQLLPHTRLPLIDQVRKILADGPATANELAMTLNKSSRGIASMLTDPLRSGEMVRKDGHYSLSPEFPKLEQLRCLKAAAFLRARGYVVRKAGGRTAQGLRGRTDQVMQP